MAIAAGTRFLGKVRFIDPAPYELGLVAQALWMLDQGLLLLGGKTARGLGWVQVEVTAVRSLSPVAMVPAAGDGEAPGFAPVTAALAEYLQHLRTLADTAAGEV